MWCNRAMGEEAMKITVVGAALVLAAVVIILVLIHAINGDRNPDPKKIDQ